MDASNLMEYGVVGVLVYIIGVLTWFLTKVLGAKYPILNGGGHAKRSADAAEKQLKNTEETNTMLKEMQSAQQELVEAHTGPRARRDNDSFKWWNDPDIETKIKETHQIIKSMNE